MQDQEFYVGYEDRLPPALAAFVRRVVIVLVLAVVGIGLIFAGGFNPLPASRFEFGHPRTFKGRIEARPYPRLVTDDRAAGRGGSASSELILVGVGKHGADPDVAAFDGRRVELRGTLAERGRLRAVEVEPGSVRIDVSGAARVRSDGSAEASRAPRSLGRQTLRGEIVDSKCFLGVMNPGEHKVHRACAIRCISGGIPPALLVRDWRGRSVVMLLTDGEGRAAGREVASLAGMPVELSGEVVDDAGQLWLRAEMSRVKRLGW